MSRDEKRKRRATDQEQSAQRPVEFADSPGQQLVKAREALGLTQAQIAERLHLRVPSIKSVEEDVPEEGVSVTFTKGYVRLYAKHVNLDADPLLDAYDRLHARNNQPAKLQSFSKRVSREEEDSRWNMVTIVVVLIVLGSVIGWWVQQSGNQDDSQGFVSETIDNLFNESENNEDASQTSESSDTNQSENGNSEDDPDTLNLNESGSLLLQNTGAQIPDDTPLGTDDLQSSINDIEETVSELDNTTNDIESNSTESLENITNTIESSEISTLEGTMVNGVNVNGDGTVNMAFTFLDDCWVSIKDVNDEVIAVGTKEKGRLMNISGLPPIRVVLGAPQHVEIDFGSKEIDMSVYPAGRSVNFQLSVESE